jgi:HD domain
MFGLVPPTLDSNTRWASCDPTALFEPSSFAGSGVAYLARMMATHLQSQSELNITDRDVGCIELAGLCHDLGHGPWSHVWDNTYIPAAL